LTELDPRALDGWMAMLTGHGHEVPAAPQSSICDPYFEFHISKNWRILIKLWKKFCFPETKKCDFVIFFKDEWTTDSCENSKFFRWRALARVPLFRPKFPLPSFGDTFFIA
jgi:hypothetical protein